MLFPRLDYERLLPSDAFLLADSDRSHLLYGELPDEGVLMARNWKSLLVNNQRRTEILCPTACEEMKILLTTTLEVDLPESAPSDKNALFEILSQRTLNKATPRFMICWNRNDKCLLFQAAKSWAVCYAAIDN